jgi:hypothetical protein
MQSIIFRQLGHLDLQRPVAFRPLLAKSLALFEEYLYKSKYVKICQHIRWGIWRVYAVEFGLKIDELPRMETS